MVLSRANAKAAFDYIFDVVLERNDDSELKTALLQEGFYDTLSFCQLTQEVIQDLTYENDTESNIPVNLADQFLVSAFIQIRT